MVMVMAALLKVAQAGATEMSFGSTDEQTVVDPRAMEYYSAAKKKGHRTIQMTQQYCNEHEEPV